MKDIEGWRLNKRMKYNVAVKSNPDATTNSVERHVRGCLEDYSPNTAILHYRTNNLKNNENAEDILTDIMTLAISVKSEKKTVVVSGITVRYDKFMDKEKNVDSMLKRKFKEEKIVLVDNFKI